MENGGMVFGKLRGENGEMDGKKGKLRIGQQPNPIHPIHVKKKSNQKQIACLQSAKMHKYLCSFGRSSAFCPFSHPSTCVIAIIQYSVYNTVPIIT
jgi:hypothetical protein